MNNSVPGRSDLVKYMLRTALILGTFAAAGAALLNFTHENTKDRIAESERQYLLKALHELIPSDTHDNDIFSDTFAVISRELLGSDDYVTIYRARNRGQPTAVAMTVLAPDGYSGTIKLLVAIRYDGTLIGVRAVSHKETPGLGDAIEANRSDWIFSFMDRSLSSPAGDLWQVKKDGGAFDQLTGATITSRAVVKAVHNSLIYYQRSRAAIFAAKATATGTGSSRRH
ncbi:MAG: electron transport complex subunit RsxG [Gammaproteobacteria bacterium]|nr:MAG: electron transport complex subunit RsxG [Gammaproteobacteria bacterium]